MLANQKWTEGRMVRRGMIRSMAVKNNCGEVQPT
jgi:hypothetical protein